MSKTKLFTIIISVLCFSSGFSQKGKSGTVTISVANTKVNEFTTLTANAAVNNTTINVAASSLNANARFTTTLTPGDLIMIIQMQGALIKLSAVPVWAPDSTYGNVYSYGSCGNYEFAEVKSVISATQIELNCGLKYSYSSAGKTQIVRVPRYSSLNIAATGTLTTDAWNGTIGGVLAVEVDGNTTINSGGVITATGLGFRGGVAVGDPGSSDSSWDSYTVNKGAEKGEGIGSDRLTNALLLDTMGKQCKGAPGNGGGGGNANNCGGGGGGNAGNINGWNGYGVIPAAYASIYNLEYAGRGSVVSSGGGKGGYATSTTFTPNVTVTGPNSTLWGSFARANRGGFGGRPLDYSTGKVFLGGGGGAGHMSVGQSNGANACSGGNGGGLIYFLNYGNISGTGTITANGANGNNAFGTGVTTQGIDGAGGAGAGGTIILNCNGTISSIVTSANGGNGGNQVKSGLPSNETQGPGGGGGGGYIAGNGNVFTQSVNGGTYGTTNSTNSFSLFPMNGATSGNSGLSGQIIIPSFSLTASANQTICAGQSVSLTAISTNTAATVLWYNTSTGGNSIATGTVYSTPVYTATGTYTLYAGSCPGIYRIPVLITVNNGSSISVSSQTICSGQTATLTASGASTYTWSTSSNSNTIAVSPTLTTTYTINGSTGTCTGSNTAVVTVVTQPTVAVANASICSGASVTLTATGATNYTWMPSGLTTASIVVSPTVNTTYSITGVNGTCSHSITSTVSVTPTPSLTVASQTICSGQTVTLSGSGATSYTWNSGAATGSTYTLAPTTSTTVLVVGANGSCTTQATSSITVGSSLSIAVNSSTICAGQSATLTAGGVTTYTWNTGPNTNSIIVSPASTTVYTVSGSTAGCNGSNTATVTVNANPTITVNSSTICSGSTVTLTANGANTYTWSNAVTGNTQTVSPSSTTSYSVIGTNTLGCVSSSVVATISVTPTPSLTVASQTICSGQTVTLSVSGATSYTWNSGAAPGSTYTLAPTTSTTVLVVGANGSCTTQATSSITVGSSLSIAVNSSTICAGQSATLTAGGVTTYTWNTGPNTNSITVSPTSTTVYTVSGSTAGCNGSNTATVTVNANPTITVNSSTICSGSTVTLTANGANTYTWSNAITGNTQTVSPSSTTSYSVIGTNTLGCVSSSVVATISVTPTPSLTVTTTSVCIGNSATLIVNGATSYLWNTTATTNSITVSPTVTTIYTVTGTNGSCSTQTTTTVIVDNTIPVIFSTPINSCPSQTVNLFASGSNSVTTTYTWSNGVHSYSQTVNPSSTTTYTVFGSNSNGCAALTGTIIVTVNAIHANYTGVNNNDVVTLGTILNLNNTSVNATTYSWKTCDGVSTNTHVTEALITAGNCCITLYANNSSCTDSITTCIEVVSAATLNIPNVFTPNGDNKNDLFYISSVGVKSLHCTVFDRWGLKMYEWDGLNGSWDGNAKSGTKAPSGTYFYIVEYTDMKSQSVIEKGFLNLFRE